MIYGMSEMVKSYKDSSLYPSKAAFVRGRRVDCGADDGFTTAAVIAHVLSRAVGRRTRRSLFKGNVEIIFHLKAFKIVLHCLKR